MMYKSIITFTIIIQLLGLTILGTSLYGGAIFSAALDYFIEKLSMVIWLWDRVSLRPVSPPPCWFSWIILGVWPTLVLLGLVIQCTVTGRGIYHDNGKTIFFSNKIYNLIFF